jgi:alkaline phosphatase D
VRVPRARSWADLTIRRAIPWGATAHLHVLDTRQYRSDQACGDGNVPVPCAGWQDPARTLLGAAQERWLSAGLLASKARWQVLANQTMMAEFDHDGGPRDVQSMDAWSGYPAARARLLRELAARAPGRAVVLTGDIHSSWVNDLHVDARRRGVPAAVELVGTSISSEGDGGDRAAWITAEALAAQPHVKWHDGRRGYLVNAVTPDDWTAEYRRVQYVSRPDAPLETATRWRMTNGRPGVERM